MSLIDSKAIDAIRALQRPGKPDMVARIVGLFASESPKLIDAVENALDELDCEAIRNASHTLKSSSAYVGASDLANLSRDIEQAARDGNLPACMALADGLRDDFDAVCVELAPLLQGHAA